MLDTLAIRTARRHVDSFTDESEEVMRLHPEANEEANECVDCEAFLQLGIDAFDWLVRADIEIRKVIYRGRVQYEPEAAKIIQDLLVDWLKPCKVADEWIAVQLKRGYKVDNLERFRECEKEVRAIVGSQERNHSMSDALRKLRDEALIEHRDGQTSEFV